MKNARPSAPRRQPSGIARAMMLGMLCASAAHPQSVAVAPASVPPSGSPPGTPPAPVKPKPDEAGYMFGIGLGQQLRLIGVTNELSLSKALQGLRDGLAGKKGQPDDQERLQALFHAIADATAGKNAAAAKQFLERNGKAKDVVTTASGLQYKIVAAGDVKAASPQATDLVTVDYRGTLLDGTEFDSSQKRGPQTFQVRGVVKGWQEALLLMKPGAKWHLYIPPELAYGSAPHPPIPPGSLLNFDIELLSVKQGPPLRGPAMPVAPPAPKS